MKFLVTGGAGFIGAAFIFYLFEKYPDSEIVCLDALTYAGDLSRLESIGNPNFKFVKGDVADSGAVRALFARENFDYAVNFAAESHVDKSIEEPGIFLRTNVTGTQVLMEACREFGIKRFHQVSTDEVYGDLPADRPDLLFTEESPVKPSSPYSASKAAADLLVSAYFRTYGFPATISRCSNNYGPYQFPEKLIPLMIYRAFAGEKLPVYGNGLNIRDWLHVKDHCSAIDLILRNGADGEIYNIGGRNEKTNIQIVKTVLKILNKPETLISYVKDRAGHDLRYAVDPSKIERELGWKSETDFVGGLADTVAWYTDNYSSWGKKVSV